MLIGPAHARSTEEKRKQLRFLAARARSKTLTWHHTLVGGENLMVRLRRSLPGHLLLALSVSFLVACSDSGGGGTGPSEDTGSIAVSAATTGDNLDPNGYTATVGTASQNLAVNGTVTFTGLTAGSHSVELSGVADNCDVTSANPQSANVQANETASVSFAVVCSGTTPTTEAVSSLEEALFTAINALENGTIDDLDQFSFEATRQLFQQLVDADPTNETAQFGLAVTTIFVLEDNSEIRDLADRWDVWLQTHSIDDLSGLDLLGVADPFFWPRASLPLDVRGLPLGRLTDFDQMHRVLIPQQMELQDFPPTLSEHQALLRDVVQPELVNALSALNAIDSPGFTFIITERMQGETEMEADPLELDQTEILALRALLEGTLAFVDAALAYVAEPSPWGAVGFADAFETGSTFATLAPDGPALLLDAQERVLRGIDLLEQGLDNLVAETDDQSDDIIKYDPTGDGSFNEDDGLNPQNVQDARDFLADAEAAMQGPRTVTEDFGWGEVQLVVDASKFFTDPIQDLKTLLPDYEVMNGKFRWVALTMEEWTFPDPTFHGILPEITSNSQLLEETLDLQSLYWDFAFPQGDWRDMVFSATSGYLVFASQGFLGAVSEDLTSVTFAPTIQDEFYYNGSAIALRTGMPEIITVDFEGRVFARPDDTASPWTLWLQTLPSGFWVDLAVTSGGVFALADAGDVVRIEGGLTTHTVLPQIAPTCCFTSMTSSGPQLVALTYSGEIFTSTDPTVGWTSETGLPSVPASWRALAAGPSGTTFAATDGNHVYQISADFSSSTALPELPFMYGLHSLATNEDASVLAAMTYDGRLFSRPTGDPVAPWVERLKIPRVRDF
jgi:hypothetical protein